MSEKWFSNIEKTVSELTLKEKCALLSGIDLWRTTPIKRVGLPSIVVSDGPHGVRKEDPNDKKRSSFPATCFPPAVTMASTWNPELVSEVASAIAKEAAHYQVDTMLGPGVNIKRNPLCGRNFEYFSEDPYLSGEMGKSYVAAMQKENVGSCVKHFAANSQEYKRFTMSSEVDERALREIYLSAFEKVVKEARPHSLMCSYNRVNGEYSSDNKKLLNDVLREEWGYDGIVISDWGAMNDRVRGVEVGMDLEMPSSDGMNDKLVEKAVKNGTLDEKQLDAVVNRLLKYAKRSVENREKHGDKQVDFDKHFDIALKAAIEGAVLLKNQKVLPLEKGERVLVLGKLADKPRFQGRGSSIINAYKTVGFLQAMKDHNEDFDYAEGYDDKGDIVNNGLLDEAVEKAKNADKVLVFVGLTDDYESEGYDRTDLKLPFSHDKLIEAVSAVNDNVCIILSCGSPVEMPWMKKVPAILNTYLGGEAAGEAVYRLVFGDAVPSGKLAETFPVSLNDDPFLTKYYHEGPRTVEYRESIFVGYRYYDAAKKEVLFPFGHGLSYAEFEYSDICINNTESGVICEFTLQNKSTVDAAEIVQVYVGKQDSAVMRAERSLCGFEKVRLKAGESIRVSIPIDKRAFEFYNTSKSEWMIEDGEYMIEVGASSRDIRLTAKTDINGESVADTRDNFPSYFNLDKVDDIPDEEYYRVFGGKPSSNEPYTRKTIDMTANFCDLKNVSFIGKCVNRFCENYAIKHVVPDASDAVKERAKECSTVSVLRSLSNMSNGLINQTMAKGCVYMMTKRVFTGLLYFICGGIAQLFHVKKINKFRP